MPFVDDLDTHIRKLPVVLACYGKHGAFCRLCGRASSGSSQLRVPLTLRSAEAMIVEPFDFKSASRQELAVRN
jgi:hypothetical protein